MRQVENGASHDEDARDMPLATVQRWRIDSTSFIVTVHLDADGFPASPLAPNQRGFVLDADQARQMIRDLSAAVLALELQRHVEQAVDLPDSLQSDETPRRARRGRRAADKAQFALQ
ncbi:hypothetical protein [Paraburkholderia youngii]|uniref:hypothetical protein n=1 Tax=Paraburkholderia youngii TaxID=2782701 RepID=UPI001595CFBF|nr:hypothetical protein [Paraburkholderia youngii]